MATTSPVVNWRITNNNVLENKPLLGISYVVARTQMGPANTPDEIFTSVRRFREVYGGEVVPDGGCSNIEYALTHGSRLRISRAKSSSSYDGLIGYTTNNVITGTGNLVPVPVSDNPSDFPSTTGVSLKATNPALSTVPGSELEVEIKLSLTEKGLQELKTIFPSATAFTLQLQTRGSAENKTNFIEVVVHATNSKESIRSGNYKVKFGNFYEVFRLISLQYDANTTATTNFPGNNVRGASFIEPEFRDYIKADIRIIKAVGIYTNYSFSSYTNLLEVLSSLQVPNSDNGNGSVELYITPDTTLGTYGSQATQDSVYLTGFFDTVDNIPSISEYTQAINSFRDYNDGYQLILSHFNQSVYPQNSDVINEEGKEATTNFYLPVISAASSLIKLSGEMSLIIGIPKSTLGKALTYDEMIDWKLSISTSIGNSEYHSYISEGVYLPHHVTSVPVLSDGLGAVLGLADTSASEYGPWYSFAGANRGVIADGSKLWYENFGIKSNIEKANDLALNRINIFVKKKTRTTSREVVMLWHNFTDSLVNNSQRFWNVQRLIYYIKKNLNPILESYLEEPNTFSTWDKIYLDGKRVMDYLETNNGITQYNWQGDQFLSSYDDLQINNEADIRNGIYKIILSIWDIVALQQIDIELVIEAPAGTIVINS